MKEQISAILNLQNIDLEIINVESEISKFPKDIKELESQKEVTKNSFKIFEEEIKKQKMLQKQLENDIESNKEKQKKLEFQLNAIKTNNEYTLMLKEIEGVKKMISGIEDKLLDVMGSIENSDLARKEKQKEIDEEVRVLDEALKEKKQELENLNKKIDQLKKERKENALKCKGDLYNRYEKYMEKKHSIVLVPLEKNGACSGCHQNLPPNIRNEVLKGKILQCDNCARLLFWKEDKEEGKEDNSTDNSRTPSVVK